MAKRGASEDFLLSVRVPVADRCTDSLCVSSVFLQLKPRFIDTGRASVEFCVGFLFANLLSE